MDVVEVPFRVETTTTTKNAKGRTAKRTSNHRFQITRTRSNDGRERLTAKFSYGIRSLRSEQDVDITMLMVVLAHRALSKFGGESVEVGERDCSPFKAKGHDLRIIALCGTVLGGKSIEAELPDPIHFESVGLPLKFKNNALLRYTFDQEFQLSALGGASLVLPKRCIGEFVFADGTVRRVENVYTPERT